MVKTKEPLPSEEPIKADENNPRRVRVSKAKILSGMVLALIIATVWTNPQLIKQAYDYIEARHTQNVVVDKEPDAIELLTRQVADLQRELEATQARLDSQVIPSANLAIDDESMTELKSKIAAIEKQNLNVIDSKADVAIVLGLVTRLDKAEDGINKLAKVSDDGALILSAAMLVKEAAAKNQPYAYEAEVLEQLAQGDEKIKEPVAIMVKYAVVGIKSPVYLSEQFNQIYDRLLEKQKEDFAKTWKDRLNNRLNQIIKVKRVNKEETPEFKQDKTLEEVKNLVDAEDFAKAVAVLNDPQNQNLVTDNALLQWRSETGARVEFENALSKISTHSLALMKVNYIKKETRND